MLQYLLDRIWDLLTHIPRILVLVFSPYCFQRMWECKDTGKQNAYFNHVDTIYNNKSSAIINILKLEFSLACLGLLLFHFLLFPLSLCLLNQLLFVLWYFFPFLNLLLLCFQLFPMLIKNVLMQVNTQQHFLWLKISY